MSFKTKKKNKIKYLFSPYDGKMIYVEEIKPDVWIRIESKKDYKYE